MDVGIKIPDTVLQSMNRYYSNLLAESTDIEKREPLRRTLDANIGGIGVLDLGGE
jgi:hypothetical protein